MARSEMEDVTAKALGKGGILVKLYFDMHSKEQSGLQPILADLINNRLLKSKGVIYGFGSIEEPIFDRDMYTTTATVTVLVDSLEDLAGVVFMFAPAAIEVMKPEMQYVIKQSELQDLLLSLSTISANYSEHILKNTMSEEEFEKVRQDLKSREELGRKILKKPGGAEGA